jgi:hypothetical protein
MLYAGGWWSNHIGIIDKDFIFGGGSTGSTGGSSGGGSSSGGSVVIVPQESYTEGNWLFTANEAGYKESNSDYQFYSALGLGYGMENHFDNDLSSQTSNINAKNPLYFKSSKKVNAVRFYTQPYSLSTYYYTHVYGTNDEAAQTDKSLMTLIGSYQWDDDGSEKWREVPIEKQYKYYAVYFGYENPEQAVGVFINEIKLALAA